MLNGTMMSLITKREPVSRFERTARNMKHDIDKCFHKVLEYRYKMSYKRKI